MKIAVLTANALTLSRLVRYSVRVIRNGGEGGGIYSQSASDGFKNVSMKTLAIFFALMVPVFARLGETEAECAARYGANLSTAANQGRFEKNGIVILTSFENDKAVRIHFQAKSNKLLGEKLTNAQIFELLKANSSGLEWQAVQTDHSGKNLTRMDSMAFASWNYFSGTLEIISAGVKLREDAERTAKRKAEADTKQREAEALRKSTDGF